MRKLLIISLAIGALTGIGTCAVIAATGTDRESSVTFDGGYRPTPGVPMADAPLDARDFATADTSPSWYLLTESGALIGALFGLVAGGAGLRVTKSFGRALIHPVPKLLLLCAVLLSASCASEVGEREDLDSGDVDDQLQNIKFSVPDGFTFGQGYRNTEFVGQGPVYLRFDAASSSNLSGAVSNANSKFLPMSEIPCSDQRLEKTGWNTLGFACTDTMLATQYPVMGGLDAVLAVITDDGKRAHLFISSAGH